MIYEILWLIIMPGVIIHWYAIIMNYKDLVYIRSEKVKYKKIVFLIATRLCQDLVQDTVNSVHAACKKAEFENYEVKVVTDVKKVVAGAEVLTIPEDYTCNSKYKARGLNYALSELPNSKDAWIFHLDEDSLVTEQTINAIHHYINNNGKPIANGLSVFVTNGNLLAFYAEAHRMWTFLWLKEQLKKAPMWMNGSNMLAGAISSMK